MGCLKPTSTLSFKIHLVIFSVPMLLKVCCACKSTKGLIIMNVLIQWEWLWGPAFFTSKELPIMVRLLVYESLQLMTSTEFLSGVQYKKHELWDLNWGAQCGMRLYYILYYIIWASYLISLRLISFLSFVFFKHS